MDNTDLYSNILSEPTSAQQGTCCKEYTCTLQHRYLIKFYNVFVLVFYTYNLTYIQKEIYYSTLFNIVPHE